MIPSFVTSPPFDLAPNLTIKVRVQTDGVTIDPNTGNETPNTKTVELKAVVTKASEAENQYRQPGGKVEWVEMKGFILCGKSSIPLSGTYPAILKGRTTAEDQVGEFDMQIVTTPFLKEINQSIGVPILGIFRRLE